jgi:hypothetical protein
MENPELIDEPEAPFTPAAAATFAIVERFGGIRPMASKLDIPVTTVQGWKKRGAIPAARHAEIIAAAARHAIDLTDLDLAFAPEPVNETVAEAGEKAAPRPGVPFASLVTPPLGKTGLNGLWLALATSLFIMIAVFLAFAGFYLVKQKASKLEQRVTMLERSNSVAPALEARLATLEQAVHSFGNTGASPEHLQDIDRRLAEVNTEASQIALLSQKVSDLQTTNGNHELMAQTVASVQSSVQSLAQSLEAMRSKVAQLSSEVADRRLESAHQFALLLSLGQLREAASTSQPFDVELNIARNLAHNDPDFTPDLDALDDYAGDGVATMNDLRVEFSDLASEIVRSNVVGSGKSWFRQALYRLGSVISVRKIGSKSHDNTAEVLVSRAEGKLEEDDLAGAVEALGGLTGLPKDVASAWVEAANRRLAVDAVLARLAGTLIERAEILGAPGAPAPAPTTAPAPAAPADIVP